MRANDMLMPKDLREANSIKGWKVVESKALRVYTQLYSLQATIASGMLSSVIPTDHIEDFRKLSVFVAEEVTPVMDDLILSLQTAAAVSNSEAAAAGVKKPKTSKKQTDHSKALPSSSDKQETLVPNLVYNMAQVDAKVVALSKKHSGKHSVDFTKALPRNMQRDFKFDENVAN
jgi:hypothetical protein